MNMSRNKTISVICLLLLTTLGLTSPGNAQTAASNPTQTVQSENAQMMQALLGEVQQLRLAIQRSNLNIYHAQIAIERMRLQQQRVDRQTEQLRGVRDHVAQIKMGQAEVQEELKRIERRLSEEADVVRRRDLEGPYESMKTRLAQMVQEEMRLREQESQLVAQLQTEQGRLAELNDQLDALQRELQIPPAENKPQQSGKRP
jgi:predicted nuclease with TOPRIM domain